MPESDPFNILGDEPEVPPSFDEAVRAAVARLQEAAERFEPLYAETPEEWFSDPEWQVIERSAEELVEAIEKAEDAYVAVMYDSHAWYRILENLEAVRLRLESATGIIRSVRDRHAAPGAG
ncbi:MAG: hypothetical protein ACK47B_25695 [Armatimonadota bacterium]